MSKVVNVKVGYIRPKYKNLEDWCKDPQNVYIGRAGPVFINKERYPKKASPFANPFKVGKHGTLEEILQKYKTYILEEIKQGRVDISTLEGKTMGCWCHPEPCHGDILLSLLNTKNKRCTAITLSGKQCVRKTETGDKCYQHK